MEDPAYLSTWRLTHGFFPSKSRSAFALIFFFVETDKLRAAYGEAANPRREPRARVRDDGSQSRQSLPKDRSLVAVMARLHRWIAEAPAARLEASGARL